MRVVWAGEARDEFRDIIAWIKNENPVAAQRVATRIKQAAEGLSYMPEKFRAGHSGGTRERVVPGLPYLLVYRLDPDCVRIIALFHTSRDIPRGG
jgi:toxin ParE1/3/4